MSLMELVDGQFYLLPTAATDFANFAESDRARICFEPIGSALAFQRQLFDPSSSLGLGRVGIRNPPAARRRTGRRN